MRLTSSPEWTTYFVQNAKQLLEVPWSAGPQLTPAERTMLVRSVQAWQLGETSDGAHLRAAARGYAQRVGDPEFLTSIDLFIREEQRHGETLGQYLDALGEPRIGRDWGDTLFRAGRYAIPSMEIWVSLVIMVETLALVYYAALRRASQCPVLRQICRQILCDEVAHIRFQYERLAILHALRPRWQRRLTYALQSAVFAAITLAVWVGHDRVLRAGGHTWRSYWEQSWRKMGFAWRQMQPENFPELRPAHAPLGELV